MNNPHCNCSHNAKPLQTIESTQDKKKTSRGFSGYLKMAIPAFVFIIIPKCPVCLAGYIALATGIGISITTATYVRFGLIVFCIISLIYFIVKHTTKWLMRNEWEKVTT